MMTKLDKTITRLLSKPKDFTWQELQKIMSQFNYGQDHKGKTSGSRIIYHGNVTQLVLHKPHPKPILKGYQVKAIIQFLKKEGRL